MERPRVLIRPAGTPSLNLMQRGPISDFLIFLLLSSTDDLNDENSMSRKTNRRQFVKTAAAAGGGLEPGNFDGSTARMLGANERLNIGVIGVGGRGAADLAGVAAENIVALCDVDEAGWTRPPRNTPTPKNTSTIASYSNNTSSRRWSWPRRTITTPRPAIRALRRACTSIARSR